MLLMLRLVAKTQIRQIFKLGLPFHANCRQYGNITPFTRTTYSHLNPHLNRHPNSVPFTRTSRKSSLVMQAALFHATRVRDASAMVFAKLLQLLLLFFWLRARRRRRIRAKRRRLSSWDHAFTASASLRWR